MFVMSWFEKYFSYGKYFYFIILQSSAAELAKHVLMEIPQQVTKYYAMRGMQPNQVQPQGQA